ASSTLSIVSSRVQAVSAMRDGMFGYGARITCVGYLRAIADSFATTSGHSQLYWMITPASSRLWTCSSLEIGRVWIPHGAMYGRCGPEVGGVELYASCGSLSVCTWRFPWSGNFWPGRSACARYAKYPTITATTTAAAMPAPSVHDRRLRGVRLDPLLRL